MTSSTTLKSPCPVQIHCNGSRVLPQDFVFVDRIHNNVSNTNITDGIEISKHVNVLLYRLLTML